MKARNQTPRIIQSSASRLLALCGAMVTILLCAGTALAQCGIAVLPGQTQSLSQASNGSATPPFGSSNFAVAIVVPSGGGTYDLAQNKIEAAAAIPIALPSVRASASAQLNYSFCVQGGGTNDTVSAIISSQVYWNGILADASVSLSGNSQPSASIVMTLIDSGSGGVIATAAPPEFNTSLSGPSFYNVITAGGTSINQSASVVLNANVTVGHSYQVQFTLDCEAPSAFIGLDNICYFASDLFPPVPGTCSGGCFAQVTSLSVSLGVDLNASILAVKADVDANRQAIAAASLTAEQENAQLLGILNEILSLLSAKPADPPPAPTSGKTKTGYPKPPIRPVRPAANDPL